jgi:hypothetical protein
MLCSARSLSFSTLAKRVMGDQKIGILIWFWIPDQAFGLSGMTRHAERSIGSE